MERFLHLQLYDTNGDLAYDNDNDTSWGIASGSCVLDNFIMESELKFGDFNSALFQAQLFGIEHDLNGYRIVVEMMGDRTHYNLVTHQGDKLVTNSGDYLVTATWKKALFTGTIYSSNTDYSGVYRDIEAYDDSYVYRDVDIAVWWDSYWTGKTSVTLATLREALLTYMQIPHNVTGSMPNDNMTVTNTLEGTLSTLSFGMVISAICQLQNCCPHIRGDGKLEFIRLKNISSDMTNKLEKYNSEWEDYTTANITGVAIYDTSDNLVKLVGTRDNVYNISGNILLLNKSQTELTNIATPLLNELSQITYTPAKLKMIESDLDYVLGQKLLTEKGQCYIFSNRLSGSLLIEQTFGCNAVGETMNQVPSDVNDTYVGNTKIRKYQIEASQEIVLKVQDDGTLALCQLMADASTGETAFVVKAGNFEVDAQGNVTILGNLTSKSKLTMQDRGSLNHANYSTDVLEVGYGEVSTSTDIVLNSENIYFKNYKGDTVITYYTPILNYAQSDIRIYLQHQTWIYDGCYISGQYIAQQVPQSWNCSLATQYNIVEAGTLLSNKYAAKSPSSKSYKENIVPITDEEAKKILDVNIYSFDYKEGFGDKGQYGVIAEEVIKQIPYAVEMPSEDELLNDDVKPPLVTVDYRKFVPHLIKTVQMQEEKINELETKIKNLEKAIEKLVVDKIIEGGIE